MDIHMGSVEKSHQRTDGWSLYIVHFGAHLTVKNVMFDIFQQELLGNQLSMCLDRAFP